MVNNVKVLPPYKNCVCYPNWRTDTAPASQQREPHGFALQPSLSYLLRTPRDENENKRKRVSNEYEWVELPKHEQNEG